MGVKREGMGRDEKVGKRLKTEGEVPMEGRPLKLEPFSPSPAYTGELLIPIKGGDFQWGERSEGVKIDPWVSSPSCCGTCIEGGEPWVGHGSEEETKFDAGDDAPGSPSCCGSPCQDGEPHWAAGAEGAKFDAWEGAWESAHSHSGPWCGDSSSTWCWTPPSSQSPAPRPTCPGSPDGGDDAAVSDADCDDIGCPSPPDATPPGRAAHDVAGQDVVVQGTARSVLWRGRSAALPPDQAAAVGAVVKRVFSKCNPQFILTLQTLVGHKDKMKVQRVGSTLHFQINPEEALTVFRGIAAIFKLETWDEGSFFLKGKNLGIDCKPSPTRPQTRDQWLEAGKKDLEGRALPNWKGEMHTFRCAWGRVGFKSLTGAHFKFQDFFKGSGPGILTVPTRGIDEFQALFR